MRKIFKVLLGISITTITLGGVLGAIFGVASIKDNNTLVFGNFGEYESPSLETSIAKSINSEYKNVSVEYTYYNLNNQLLAMYANNQISIGVPTDYEAAELISLGLIKPLNYSLFNEDGMSLDYYCDGQKIPIENGILPIQVNLQEINDKYNIKYTDSSDSNLPLAEQYATEYKYSICNLLSPSIICDLTQIYLNCDFNNVTHIDILDYDLPYFFQDYTFAYTTYNAPSNELNALNSLDQPNTPWKKIMSTISSLSWFHSRNGKPSIGLVASPQSVYSVASTIQNYQDNNTVPVTNPTADNSSIQDMTTTFEYFTKYLSSANLGANPVYNSSSSAGVINELDNSQLRGGFCYNGDALYTAMGGNLANSLTDKQWNNLTPQTFHVIDPQFTMIALDTVGINSLLPSNLLLPAYKFLYDLCLEGVDASPTFAGYSSGITANGTTVNCNNTFQYLKEEYKNDPALLNLIEGNDESVSCPFYYWAQNNSYDPWENVTKSTPFIGTNNNGTYFYGPMQNFSFNLYVSPWLNINNFVSEVMTQKGASVIGNATAGMNWFTSQTAYSFPTNTSLKTYDTYNNWFEDIYKVNPTNYVYTIPKNINYKITYQTCVELPLSKYQISNQQIAFTDSMYQDFK